MPPSSYVCYSLFLSPNKLLHNFRVLSRIKPWVSCTRRKQQQQRRQRVRKSRRAIQVGTGKGREGITKQSKKNAALIRFVRMKRKKWQHKTTTRQRVQTEGDWREVSEKESHIESEEQSSSMPNSMWTVCAIRDDGCSSEIARRRCTLYTLQRKSMKLNCTSRVPNKFFTIFFNISLCYMRSFLVLCWWCFFLRCLGFASWTDGFFRHIQP